MAIEWMEIMKTKKGIAKLRDANGLINADLSELELAAHLGRTAAPIPVPVTAEDRKPIELDFYGNLSTANLAAWDATDDNTINANDGQLAQVECDNAGAGTVIFMPNFATHLIANREHSKKAKGPLCLEATRRERSGVEGFGMSALINRICNGIAILVLVSTLPAHAFDESKVLNGLYYNGTDVNQQLWTPLVLAQDGKLIDPLLYAQANGVKALEGQGRTTYLHANTTFLYGGCRTDTKLLSVQPLIAKVPTVYVGNFVGEGCARKHADALENFHLTRDRQGNNPMPTLFVKPLRPEALPLWIYGVPGMLVGKYLPVRAWSLEELGGTPQPINGVISRSHFVTLPVLEPDELRIARLEKRPSSKYDVDLGEAAHRSSDVVVTSQLHQTATAFIKEKLWRRYYPRLQAALAQRFDGIAESYFELGLMQGVDIDNTRSFDYVGVARIGVVTKAGPWRWIDVVWCWRSGLGQSEEALQVLRTSEDALYESVNNYFSNKRPSLWSPNLVVSGFADFDKDKRLEVISTLVRPVGMAYEKVGSTSGSGYDLWLRESAIHAWLPDAVDARRGTWQTVFKSAIHEERIVTLRPEKINIELFGE